MPLRKSSNWPQLAWSILNQIYFNKSYIQGKLMFDNLSLTKINRLLTKIFFHLNTFQLIPQNIREYKIKKNISTK